jgi:hypothetical protein
MKKTTQILALLLMATITLTSCKDNKKSSEKDEEKKESKADDKNDETSSVGNTSSSNTSGNNLESDAVKFASLICNFQKAKASGDTVLIMRIDKEGQAFSDMIKAKYKSEKEKEKFQEILKSEASKCK